MPSDLCSGTDDKAPAIALGRSEHMQPEGPPSIAIGPRRRLPPSTLARCKVKWSGPSRCCLKMVELLQEEGVFLLVCRVYFIVTRRLALMYP